MSDEMTKVYCCDRPDNSALWGALMSKNNESPAEIASLLNNNNMMNNPFFYLIFLMLFRNGFWGNGEGAAMNANADINRLSAQVADNNNTQLLRDAIAGNATAIGQLANTINCDYNTMSQAVCGVKSAIETVGGQVGYSSERVINAVNMGDSNIVSQLQNCCCGMKTTLLETSSAAQLQSCQNHGAVMSRIDQLANGVQQGFSQIGFQMQVDKSDIINAQTANTQRMLDTLNNHWSLEQSQALQDAKNEISQLKQTQTLLASLKGCNCNGCNC